MPATVHVASHVSPRAPVFNRRLYKLYWVLHFTNMPGGRSLGCRTCKHRKIKVRLISSPRIPLTLSLQCDETQPICMQCEKAGRVCTGALTPFIYHNELSRPEVGIVVQQDSPANVRKIRWRPVLEAKARVRTTSTRKLPPKKQEVNSRSLGYSAPSVYSMTSGSLAERLAHIIDRTRGTGYDVIVCGEWLPDVVCRIGHNAALDAAVETLLLAHRNLTQPYSRSIQQAQIRCYGKAISALKVQLDSNCEHIEMETLCAVLALATSEFLNGSDIEQPAWISHSGGSAAMFQAYGPQRLRTRVERSLLYHQAAQIIGSSLVTNTDCFLNSPEWLAVFESECEYLAKWDELSARLASVYATLPALMRDVNMNLNSTSNSRTLLDRALAIRERLSKLEPIVQTMLADHDTVQKVSNDHNDAPFPKIYRISSLLAAQSLLVYWRLIIIMDNVIRDLMSRNDCSIVSLEELEMSSLQAAEQIAMAAEHGRRTMPIAAVLYSFGVTAALWAYSHVRYRKHRPILEIRWLRNLLYEYLDPMTLFMRTMLVRYLDAVKIPIPEAAIFKGLTAKQWDKCKVREQIEVER